MSTEENLAELKSLFNTEETDSSRIYITTAESDEKLEDTAKQVYREFLEFTSWGSKEAECYFEDWEDICTLQGPFCSKEEQEDAFNELASSDGLSGDLDWTIGSDQHLTSFKKCFLASDTGMIKMYNTGDGDIMHGLVIIANNLDSSRAIVFAFEQLCLRIK